MELMELMVFSGGLRIFFWGVSHRTSASHRVIVRFLDFRQLPAVLDSFAGAEVCKELKDSQLLHDLYIIKRGLLVSLSEMALFST